LVWQTTSYAMLAALEVAIIVVPGVYQEQRFYLAAVFASIPMLSFFVAYVARSLYHGALYDPNGIPPLRVVIFGAERRIDMNLGIEVVAVLMLVGIVAFFRLE
jgi:hypothetical protein